MSGNHFMVNTNAVTNTVSDLETRINNINTNLSAMYSSVQRLNTMWKGQANQSFNEQFQMDYNVMKQMLKGLKDYKNSMEMAKKKYITCENSVQDLVRNIKV